MPQESPIPGFCIGASSRADFAGIAAGRGFQHRSNSLEADALQNAAKIGAKRLQIDDAVAGKHAGTRLPGDFERNESHDL